jgi:pentatricopeptide repeat protein
VIYTTLLSSISKQHKCLEALQLFDRVVAEGFVPDLAFFQALLSSTYLGVDIKLKKKRISMMWTHLSDTYSANKLVMNKVCSIFCYQVLSFDSLDIGRSLSIIFLSRKLFNTFR